jgi:hypothetical protein
MNQWAAIRFDVHQKACFEPAAKWQVKAQLSWLDPHEEVTLAKTGVTHHSNTYKALLQDSAQLRPDTE